MAFKRKVFLPLEIVDAIMTFIVSLSVGDVHSYSLFDILTKLFMNKTRDSWLYFKCVPPWLDDVIVVLTLTLMP